MKKKKFSTYNLIGDDMKKLFQIIGIISLMGISFFYTEKTINVVKEYDDIMINIKNNRKYNKKYMNAIVDKDTIIPGRSGIEINIDKSYSRMKRYGKYNESLIVLKKIKPKISINNNKKYIISGNKYIKNISLIFIVNDDIDDIINILDNKKIKGNFFVNTNWLEKNTNLIPLLIREKHIVGLYDYSNYEWSRNIIKKIGKQKYDYCYADKRNSKILNKCDYTFIPSMNINKNFYEKTKLLQNGSIISYNVNKQLIEELPIIINYIKSKGYNIVSLKELFNE